MKHNIYQLNRFQKFKSQKLQLNKMDISNHMLLILIKESLVIIMKIESVLS